MKKIFPLSPSRYGGYIKGQAKNASIFLSGPGSLALKSWPQQFTPLPAMRSEADSCILANGIPKSGTYLLNRIVEFFSRWEKTGLHINRGHWGESEPKGDYIPHLCFAPFAVKKIRNGQLVAAHLPWNRSLEKVIAKAKPERRIKHLLIYRDPRDVFVSYMRMITYAKWFGETPKNRAHQQFMQTSFANDDDRLAYVIKDILWFPFRQYLSWLENRHCLAVKFEDLYQAIALAKEGRLAPVLVKLLDYLELELKQEDLARFNNFVFNKSPTASSEPDKVGQYKRYFREQHYALIDQPEFRKTVEAFDYQW